MVATVFHIQSDTCIFTHILHNTKAGRAKGIKKLGQLWMPRATFSPVLTYTAYLVQLH